MTGEPSVTVETAYPTPPTPCALTKAHAPKNLTLEFHHIVPVAWQLFWQPTVAPFPGRDPDGRGMLWDNRGVWVCPTHHRNIHADLVALMHEWSAPSRTELVTAETGMQRFVAVGGSLAALVAAGEWGES